MSGNEEPRVLGFLCNWCAYAGADLAGVSRLQLPANFCVIRTMCSARTEPLFLFKALLGGMDGVLVAGCHPGDCHYQRGNYFTRRRLVMVQEILKALNMEHERVRLHWISASECSLYQKVLTEFIEDLKGMERNVARDEVFL
ncbi:MAG: hydrogenase iron-sulfur subunit [Euryarchaeota archaeon]|nr:hydrogenase iron-sulfur subunit [Euryarchaeota archaeon]